MRLEIHRGAPPEFGRLVWEQAIRTRPDSKAALVTELRQQLQLRTWVNEADGHWLALCCDEALVNAMLHGNEGDPALRVQVRLWDAGADWVLQFDDQGEGFVPEAVPDPEEDASLLLEHGRGILIMRQWLDVLAFYRGGSCAVLRRHKQSHDRADDRADAQQEGQVEHGG